MNDTEKSNNFVIGIMFLDSGKEDAGVLLFNVQNKTILKILYTLAVNKEITRQYIRANKKSLINLLDSFREHLEKEMK